MQSEKINIQIQDDVEDELRRNGAVDAVSIGVAVEDGVVVLSGHVFNAAQRREAEEAARRVPGVRAIVDDLGIRPPDARACDEADLARAVRRALDWDPEVPDDRVQVVVCDGYVRLEGTVDSPHEKDAAGAAVCEALGRGHVENALAVRPRAVPVAAMARDVDRPYGEDDFDTLGIDPGPGNGEAIESRERRPRPGREGSVSQAATDRVDWLDE